LATKKRDDDKGEAKPKKAKAGTATKPAKRPAGAARPRIRSHSAGPGSPGDQPRPAALGRGPRKRTPGQSAEIAAAVKAGRGGRTARDRLGPSVRKAPLLGPKRTVKRAVPPEALPAPSSAARELALAVAGAGLDKKAIGVEILDVTGKVDYADFLVVMTGRSDRHVHAIATGLEEAMRKRKLAPLSVEGLSAATWVLLDFGDVVVHVFQEDARSLYDIEGLWIDAGRVPVPADGPPGTSPDHG
jgi:ribosome-associated protein